MLQNNVNNEVSASWGRLAGKFPGKRWAFRTVLGVVSSCLLFAFYGWIYLEVLGLETPKHARLRKESAELHSRLNLLSKRIQTAESSLEDLQLRDNDVYRSIFGMDVISDEVRRAGYGGTDRFDYLASSDWTGLLTSTARYLNEVNKMAFVQSKSLDDISRLSRKAGDMALCIPSICPVYREKVRFTSRFGVRVDPIGKTYSRMHKGVDFAGAKGQPIFVTGNGKVVNVVYSRSGYGNCVDVDHGFGYVTRYAHLQMILVTRGQEVTRGEQIATLGNSGRTTAPHLHYEVIFRGKPQNPANYYNSDISSEDYATLVSPNDGKRKP